MNIRHSLQRLVNSIGTKIIFPYVLLTLIVAGIGAFIVTNLVTGTLQERFDNQLLDAGRVVAEIMVDYEQDRLAVLRAVAGTEGVPEALIKQDIPTLISLVPQILANSNTDALILLDNGGVEVYSWFRAQEMSAKGVDFSNLEDVRLVLNGYVDDAGNRRVMLTKTPYGFIIFTLGPVFQNGEQVGAVLVGTDIDEMVMSLTENAIARVTLYDTQGEVIGTSLSSEGSGNQEMLEESPELYQQVAANAQDQVPTRSVNVRNQNYLLAYGDWRLRGQSFGIYSVALPSNFIVNAAATSRSSLSMVFSMATIGVFAIGYTISQRIVSPLNRLVKTSAAVTQGNLNQRTGIIRGDEIGVLAQSFDNMTQTLEIRNEQLIEQASNLRAILHSIADAVIVLDRDDKIVTTNPSAQKILQDVAYRPTDDEKTRPIDMNRNESLLEWLTQLTTSTQTHRLKVGNRVFSALTSSVTRPDDTRFGSVIVMRDITREVEAEERQNAFITNISHELRTPLTSVKGYISLLLANSKDDLSDQNRQFAEVIENNTDTLVKHVNRLMEIAEIQTGTLKLKKEHISLKKVVEETVQTWEAKMGAKGISLTLESINEELWVLGDSTRLSWAISNMLQNAYDYTYEDGSVHIRVFGKDDQACVSIADSGVGINATDQPFIFERFYRIDNELTYNTPGMGLGLFIVRFIIENHMGNVSVESQPGVGSTFHISLPLDANE